ncbi:MAG: hypothetical protein DRN03_02930 [Thermoplasmata archaeon]|nr:MAG: hypothetical protein DRN03_02930 [Thermoplasmata archaeon]
MKYALGFFSAVCFIGSIIFIGVGLHTMYTYGLGILGDYRGHIVKGDAFNFIIIANRGIGWINIGIISSIIGSTLAILAKGLPEGDTKRCPFCAEIIKAEARVCRYCGRELPEEAALEEATEASEEERRKLFLAHVKSVIADLRSSISPGFDEDERSIRFRYVVSHRRLRQLSGLTPEALKRVNKNLAAWLTSSNVGVKLEMRGENKFVGNFVLIVDKPTTIRFHGKLPPEAWVTYGYLRVSGEQSASQLKEALGERGMEWLAKLEANGLVEKVDDKFRAKT